MKALVLLSGGMDSTVLLHHLKAEGFELEALSIDYGQRHWREVGFAASQAAIVDVPYRLVNLGVLGTVLGGNSQTDDSIPVPHGHYEAENMKLTVVPNRNMILLAIAAGNAISRDCSAVAYAAHAGDHAIYPDCRAEFATAMQGALALCHYTPIELLRPFVTWTKADIVRRGDELGVDFSKTWSCYEGQETHCGKCGTCVERIEAFKLAGVADPTEYTT